MDINMTKFGDEMVDSEGLDGLGIIALNEERLMQFEID